MDGIIYFALAIAFLTVIAVEVVKSFGIVSKQYAVGVSLVIGILIGGIAFVVPELRADLSLGAHLIGGALTGASAAGIYDLKKIVDKKD